MTTGKVAIVIPARNEEDALRSLLPEIPREIAQWIIVVDNGSSDQTAQVARAGGSIVASEPVPGYGRAWSMGCQMASRMGTETVIIRDGDGSDVPADLPLMLAP